MAVDIYRKMAPYCLAGLETMYEYGIFPSFAYAVSKRAKRSGTENGS